MNSLFTRLSQLWGITRYEALLQFRRRGAGVVTLFSLFALIALSLISGTGPLGGSPGYGDDGSVILRIEEAADGSTTLTIQAPDGTLSTVPAPPEVSNLTPRWMMNYDTAWLNRTFTTLFMLGIGIQVILIALLPVMAETVPIDHQLKVRESLDALPVPQSIYLAGKIFGAWIVLSIGWVFVLLIYGLFMHFRLGSFDFGTYVRLWLVTIFPGGLIASGMSMLVASLVKTRRTAVLVGLLLIPVAIWMCVQVYLKLFEVAMPTSSSLMTFSYPQLIDHMTAGIFSTMLSMLPLLGIAAVGAWAFARFREARQ